MSFWRYRNLFCLSYYTAWAFYTSKVNKYIHTVCHVVNFDTQKFIVEPTLCTNII